MASPSSKIQAQHEVTQFDRVDEGFSDCQDIHNMQEHDQKDMSRMGKQQELRRNFQGVSTIAFTVVLMGTWEVILAASYQGLASGGLAGMFWSYLWSFCGFSLVVISLAEMASMAPTSGGQYHWSVSRKRHAEYHTN